MGSIFDITLSIQSKTTEEIQAMTAWELNGVAAECAKLLPTLKDLKIANARTLLATKVHAHESPEKQADYDEAKIESLAITETARMIRDIKSLMQTLIRGIPDH